jgi:hypothetical protein
LWIVLNGIEIFTDECRIDAVTYRWSRIKLKTFERLFNKNAKKGPTTTRFSHNPM